MDSPLSSINKSIFITRTPVSLPPQLPVSSLRKILKRGLTVAHPEVKGLGVKLLFNKNVIKPEDNEEYIKEAVDIIAILRVKQGCDCKDNILVYLKVFLN